MRNLSATATLSLALMMAPAARAQDAETPQEREDRGYLTALLEDNLSGTDRQVIIEGFQGALSSRATITRMTIADGQGVWLTLNDVTLDWSRSALLTGRVAVNELSAAEILLERLPAAAPGEDLPSPEATPFALPDLPVSVEIGKLSAPRIVLGETILGEPIEARLEAAASLSGGEGQASLILERTDGGPDGSLNLSGSYANSSKQLILDLTASEGAGGIAARMIGLPGTPAVDLTVKGAGPITDFTATLALASDGADRLAGTVALRGGEDGTQGFAVDLGGDIAPLFMPDYAEFFGDQVRLAAQGARTAAGVLTLQDLALETHALDLQGAATIAADGLPEKLDLTMQLGQPDGSPVLLPTSGEDRIYLESGELALKFDAAEDATWRASGRVTGLDQAAMDASKIEFSGTGHIRRQDTGNLVDGSVIYGVHDLALADPGLAVAVGSWLNGHVVFNWQQGGNGLELPDIAARGAGLTARGAITLAGLDSDLRITATAEADVADMSRFSALSGQNLGGSGKITLDGTYSPLTGAFDGDIGIQGQNLSAGIAEVDNLLRGPSTVDLSARRDETGTVLRRLDVQARTLRLTGAGTVATARSDLTADLAFTDLSVMGNGYRGALTGKARVTGTVENADLVLDATGTDLAIGMAEVDGLMQGQSLLGVTVTKTGDSYRIDRATVANPQVDAQVSGSVAGTAPVMDLAATLNLKALSAIGGGYRGAMQAQATVQGSPQDGRITLQATGQGLAIGNAQADRLLAGDSRLAADLALQDGRIRVNSATLQNPQVSADATGEITGDSRTVDLNARLANLGLLLPEFPGPLTVSGNAVETASGIRLDISAQGPGQIAATVAGTVAPDYGSADLAIRGSGQAALVNVFLDPRALTGALNYDLRLNGPLQLSSLSGRVSLANGRLVDPSFGSALQALTVTANLSGGRADVTAGAELSTGGRLALNGTLGLEAPYSADLAAQINGAVLRDPSLYQTIASGQVTVRGPLTGGATIAGQINLRDTELRIPSTGFGGLGALPDLRHFNEPAQVRRTRARAGADGTETSGSQSSGGSGIYGLDLLISAPNRVFIRGRGLDAELGGELRLSGTTANVVPSGGFDLIRGRLDILGKRLDLSEATMRMEGDFIPDLAIAATTDSDGVAVSVRIDGPATEPEVTFTSSPELPQEEVLARLLFGQGLENISALQAAQLAGAVMTLAGRGGEGIVGRLRTGFGLDNLDVRMDGDGGASVAAGKYLARNLYTEIELNQDGQSDITLNLDVNRSVTLRARAGSDGDSGLGVYYEKDY